MQDMYYLHTYLYSYVYSFQTFTQLTFDSISYTFSIYIYNCMYEYITCISIVI